MSTEPLSLRDELRQSPVLADLSESEMDWLVAHVEEQSYAAGEATSHEGEPVERLMIILEGEIQARAETSGPNIPAYIASAGDVTGLLPHSRMTRFTRTVRAVVATRVAWLHKRHFDEMLRVIPVLGPRLVGVMADRIRETTKSDIQYEKLAALGKLAAGLAHELNNPASAARSSAGGMLDVLGRLRQADRALGELALGSEARSAIAQVEDEAIEHASACTAMDALTRSDREERIGEALTSLGVEEGWALAPELVDAGLDEERLNSLVAVAGTEAIGIVLHRLAAILELYKLATEVQDATTRVSDLVKAIKEYSWMDTSPEREVDVHDGIETTLKILKHRWKSDIAIERDYDPNLPQICAHGGELNQVWTNLINNAIDALSGATGEKLLRIHTRTQAQAVLVEILDTGPGIPPEISDRIFEPFFTTKRQSEGTGLGLDLVFRIIRKHKGDIRFESRPGRTCFQVRLPIGRVSSAA